MYQRTKNPKIPNINVGPALTWGVSPITLRLGNMLGGFGSYFGGMDFGV